MLNVSPRSAIAPRMTMLEDTRAESASEGFAQEDASLGLHDQVPCAQCRGGRALEGLGIEEHTRIFEAERLAPR